MEQNLITELIYCCAVEEILSKYILFFLVVFIEAAVFRQALP
jgi:hypothetical protein